MSQTPVQAGESIGTAGNGNAIWLIICWLWVGIPLAWGVSRTIETSLALFH